MQHRYLDKRLRTQHETILVCLVTARQAAAHARTGDLMSSEPVVIGPALLALCAQAAWQVKAACHVPFLCA